MRFLILAAALILVGCTNEPRFPSTNSNYGVEVDVIHVLDVNSGKCIRIQKEFFTVGRVMFTVAYESFCQ